MMNIYGQYMNIELKTRCSDDERLTKQDIITDSETSF